MYNMTQLIKNLKSFSSAVEGAVLYPGRSGLCAHYPGNKHMDDELISEFKNLDLLIKFSGRQPDMESPIGPEKELLDNIPVDWLSTFGIPLPEFVHPFIDNQLGDENGQTDSGTTTESSSDGIDQCGDSGSRGSREEDSTGSGVDSSSECGPSTTSGSDGGHDSGDASGDVLGTDSESSTESDESTVSEESVETEEEVDVEGQGPDIVDDGSDQADDATAPSDEVESVSDESGDSSETESEIIEEESAEVDLLDPACKLSIIEDQQDELTTGDLKKLCEAYGLGQSGTKSALVKRINKHRQEG